MDYKESISHLLSFLATSRIDATSTQDALKLLVEITKADQATVEKIQKELVARVCSDGSHAFKDNALNTLMAIAKTHPNLPDYHSSVPMQTITDISLAKARLLD